MDYDEVLDGLITWSANTTHVRAVLVTGSAAAGDAHSLSDRDIEIYTRDVDALLDDESWWQSLGEVLVAERLENDQGFPTRLVYYVGGKLDFTIVGVDRLPNAEHSRPFQVLLDKDRGAPDPTLVTGPPAAALPDHAEFDESLQWGYAAALMCAKAVVRDEPWSAKLRDNDFKDELLRMIEWDHRLRYGTTYDTRFLGARMNTWMDDDVRDELATCWGRFDSADTASALRHSVELFSRLANRIALGLHLPTFPHQRLRTEIEDILAMRARSVR